MSDVNTRLLAVEDKLAAIEGQSDLDLSRTVSDAVRTETASLARRLDEFEDRSRRENLLFHGLPDNPNETWEDSEKKVRELLRSILKLQLSDEAISRAHRLGKFSADKCRPLIVRFSSFKTKKAILSARKELKKADVNVSEDFCVATRASWRKLIEFGKASGEQYSVRYNKLFINKKCYVYVPSADCVSEIDSQNDTPDQGSETSGSASKDAPFA